jgi:hypothetical protein
MDFGGVTQGGAAFEPDGVAVPEFSAWQVLNAIPCLREVPPATLDRLTGQARGFPAGSLHGPPLLPCRSRPPGGSVPPSDQVREERQPALRRGSCGRLLPLEKHFIASQLARRRATFSRALVAFAYNGLRTDVGMVVLQDAYATHSRFPLEPLDGPEAALLSFATKGKWPC